MSGYEPTYENDGSRVQRGPRGEGAGYRAPFRLSVKWMRAGQPDEIWYVLIPSAQADLMEARRAEERHWHFAGYDDDGCFVLEWDERDDMARLAEKRASDNAR